MTATTKPSTAPSRGSTTNRCRSPAWKATTPSTSFRSPVRALPEQPGTRSRSSSTAATRSAPAPATAWWPSATATRSCSSRVRKATKAASSTAIPQRVSFDHIEAVTIVQPTSVIIVGTNADDDITVIARDFQVTDNPSYPGTDGIRDFTVAVNDGLEVLYIDVGGSIRAPAYDFGELHIDGLAGDDDIVIRAPAPNQAPLVDAGGSGRRTAVRRRRQRRRPPGAGNPRHGHRCSTRRPAPTPASC